ncbi:MAG: winged helix-turn-helix domain-containing protein, partial [Acidimicrobiia bacterium]|nr:winged helix-turn-helix domain-containing protein [Acidimicrobiia bacterium]
MAGSFNVLGPLHVLIDGIDVTPRAPKERSLLALMVMSHGQVVSADRMIDEFWPNLAVDRARRVLWVRIAGLRKSLQRANAAPLLQFVSPGYRLAVDSAAIDAERFSELVRRARSHRQAGDRAAAADVLRDALKLWRGEPLADAQGCVSLETEARNLAEIRLDAIEDWIDDELACGRHAMVQGELSRLVAAHLLRERLCRLYIVCLCRAGRRADALMECQSLTRRLADELGVEPSPELTRLEQSIQGRDPSLVDARSRPTSLPTTADMVGIDGAVDRRSGVHRATFENDELQAPRHAAVNEEAPAIRAAADNHNLPVAVTRFVGRAAELYDVGELLGSSRLVTLTGVGGV